MVNLGAAILRWARADLYTLVPDGDAPTTIKMMIRRIDAFESAPTGMLLNPAVVIAFIA